MSADATDRKQQGNAVDSRTEKIGFRRALVVEDKLIDQDGLTFLFEINNIRIFCGGQLLYVHRVFGTECVLP